MHKNEYAVFDPATLLRVGTAPDFSEADVDRSVARSELAAAQWSRDLAARRELMLQAADQVRANQHDIASALTLEQGKPLRDALLEVSVCADLLEYYGGLAFEDTEQLPQRQGRTPRVQYRPVGVVGAITPWNFPLSLLMVKTAPALLAGCTVLARPSATTPLSTILLFEVLSRVLPEDVVQVCTGQDRTVSVALANHPNVRKISFTGSTGVGISLAQRALDTVKRVTLELGGNDPAIVLDDVNVEAAARQLMASAFKNSGQVCMAAKRIYVPESIASSFVDAAASVIGEFTLGHGLEPESSHGPLHNDSQLQVVSGMVAHAQAAGARVVTGGRAAEVGLPGYFYEPTLMSNCQAGMALVDQEQFGNALPIVTYRDIDDAIRQANDSEFGLGASVWGTDLDRADGVAVRLEAGTVWVNQHTVVELDAPFGGWKQSGLGRERGRAGLEPYLETRTINVAAAL